MIMKEKQKGNPSIEKATNVSILTIRLLLTCLLSVLCGGFHFGYQIAIMNPMVTVLQEFIRNSTNEHYFINLTSSQLSFVWSSIVGIMFIGAFIGATLMSFIIETKGPKDGILYAAIILLFSLLFCGFSYILNSPELFIFTRLLSGIGIGMGTTAHAVYLAEISPVCYRGFTGCFGGISTNLGYILGAALGMPFVLGSSHLWHHIYYIEAVPCFILILANILTFHDSPVYLLTRNKRVECENAIKIYCGKNSLAREMERVEEESRVHNSSNLTFRQIIKNKATRRALCLAVTLNVVVPFSGILAVSFFGSLLFQTIGFSTNGAALANCCSALSGSLGEVVGIITVEKLGRRFLIINCLIMLTIINIFMMILSISYKETEMKWMTWIFLFLFVLFIFIFDIGVGPTAWFIASELSPSKGARAKIQSISVAAQYMSSFLSPIVYFPLSNYNISMSYLVFILPLSISSYYFYRYLPETKGRTTEQIRFLLEKSGSEK